MRSGPRGGENASRVSAGGSSACVVFVGALVIWEIWARAENSFYVPPLTEVLDRAWHVWPTNDFLTEASSSVKRLAAGFVIGAGLGIAIGLPSWVPPARRGGEFSSHRSSSSGQPPPIAIVPAFIVVLGFGDSMRIGVIAFGVCFPFWSTRSKACGRYLQRYATRPRCCTSTEPSVSFASTSPAALPSIMAGLRIGISIGLVLVVVSEFVGEGGGLGHYILDQQGQFNVPEMYAGILFLGLLGYVLNRVFVLVERRVLAWHYGAAGDPAR